MTSSVLIFVEDSAPSRYFSGAAARLVDLGWRVRLATVRPAGRLHDQMRELGVEAAALGCRSLRDYPGGVARLARLVEDWKVDIVHAHESIPAGLSVAAARLTRPSVRVFHWHHDATPFKQRPFRWLGVRGSHSILAVSKSAADAAVAEGARDDRVRVTHNGVERLRAVSAGELETLRHSLSLGPDVPIATMVARMRPVKGHQTLISALPLLSERSISLHVVFVGGGDEKYERELRARAASAAPGRCHFVGPREDVAPWYALGTLAVTPSDSEAFGLVAVEAMASARALVASVGGGLREVVVHGSSGLLVEPGNAEALARAITDVVQRPELREALARGGLERYRSRFTMDHMVAHWVDAYRSVLPSSSS